MAEAITSPILAGVPHGFSTREGLEAGDVLPGAQIVRVRQVHSARVEIVRREGLLEGDAAEAAAPEAAAPEADAMVTAAPGILLAIVTADCAPVLLADSDARVIGAAHAGWRGALEGVLENTVTAMIELGASPARIRAAVGPCIAQPSYEVDAAFRDRFAADDGRFFAPGRAGHWQFDLPAYVRSRLEIAGVGAIDDVAQDTYAQASRFHSYRRATHEAARTGGRQVSLIGLHETQ